MFDLLKESQQRLSTSAFQNRFQIELGLYTKHVLETVKGKIWHRNFLYSRVVCTSVVSLLILHK